MFYFLWHDRQGDRVLDVSRILAADHDALKKPQSPLWGGYGTAHYWGEPLYGYYRSDDPWVLRRHAALLADAGIDTLIFDATNAVTYRDQYMTLCDEFAAVRARRRSHTADRLHGPHGSRQNGRPNLSRSLQAELVSRTLVSLAGQAAAALRSGRRIAPEVRAFFTLRTAYWPDAMVNTALAWHWEATYPQPYGFVTDPSKPEEVNVSVAQNLRISDGKPTCMSDGNARGRGFHDGREEMLHAGRHRIAA